MNHESRYRESVIRYSPYESIQPMNGLLDTFQKVIDQGTSLYNANSAFLDPLRDNAINTVVQSYAPKSAGTTAAQFTNPASNATTPAPAATPAPMTTGVKVALGVAGALTVGGLIWALIPSKKKKVA